jgi:archaellum component FlaC
MANRRDLVIGIDGDSRGLDKAVKDSEDSLRGLDRELQKLERQQAAQEKVTARTAVAIKKYGSEQDKAALAARRLGTEAERAAQQAAQAQIRAAAAADAYSRGLIDEERSLRAAARAEDATERAAIKAAEAHRAAAKAAEDQAQQERQLAREAELGAAAENLAIFKASGRVREHNALLGSMQAKYGDVGKTALSQFTTMETAGGKAAAGIGGMVDNLSILGKSGPVSLGLIAAAIEILPTAATIAGGGIALGLGGALSYIALKAQASSADVQAAFAQLKTNVTTQFASISAPFRGVLMDMIADAQGAFNALAPSLQAAFAQMAPAVSRFAHDVANSATAFDPVIRSISVAFSRVLDALGSRMGTIMGNVATGIKAVTDAVAANPQALANFAASLSQIVRYTGDSIGFLIRYASQINTVIKAVNDLVNPLGKIESAIFKVKGWFDGGGKAAVDFGNSLGGLPPKATPAQQASQKLAKDMQTLSSTTASAEDKTNALSDAFTRLLDPQLAAYQDTAKLQQGINDLTAALVKSHGALGDNSQAARDAKNAFAGVLKDAEQFAGELLRSGDTLDVVQQKLVPYILSLYKAAGGNKQARDLVDAFVKSVGLVPPKKGTELYNNAAQQKKAIQDYQRQINSLKGKKVDIYQVMHLTETQAYLNKRKSILGYASGGIVHRAGGGPVQHLADGGPSGMVSGPGTGTSDSILTALSNKEYVVNAKATAQNLPLLEAINSGVRVPAAPAVMSGASGGSSPSVDVGALARAVAQAMRSEGVGAAYLDGKAITDNVSRRMGQATDQRRRTG